MPVRITEATAKFLRDVVMEFVRADSSPPSKKLADICVDIGLDYEILKSQFDREAA